MAINTFGSNLRVETNVQGQIVDNDEFVAEKAHQEHTAKNTPDPWSQSYVTEEERARQLKEMYQKENPVEADPAVLQANRELLKAKGIYH